MRRFSLRNLTLVLVVFLTASTVFVTPTASAQGTPVRDGGAEAGFLASLNAQRAAGGLGPLTLNSSMTSAANGWAFEMANGSFLAHASDIISGTPGGWTKVGENVGRGQSVSSLTTAFMNSPGHRANIMDGTYTHIGIAVYAHPTDGRIYTTHRFAALGTPAPAPAPVVPTAVPVAPTPIPVVPTPIPAPPTAVPVAPTPIPVVPTPIPAPPTAVPVAPTPIPVAPTPIPAAPTAAPTVEPTPIAPTATPVPPTPVPPTPTPVPPTPVPPTPAPVPPTATPEISSDSDFGTPPERLAFVDPTSDDAATADPSSTSDTELSEADVAILAEAKLASKMAKLNRATERANSPF